MDVLGADERITIFNQYIQPDGSEGWTKTEISNVSWQEQTRYTVQEDGVRMARTVDIVIPLESAPCGKEYVKPEKFQDAEDKSTIWSLQEGDRIAKGVLELDATAPDLVERLREYPDCVTVLAWEDNRFSVLPHWYVGGG